MDFLEREKSAIRRIWTEWAPNPSDLASFTFVFMIGLAVAHCGCFLVGVVGLLSGWAFHECGHALAGFWAGYFAVPTPFFTVPMSIPGVEVVFPLVLVGLYWIAIKNELLFLRAVALLILVIDLVIQAFLDQSQKSELIVAAGLGGDLVLGTLACLAFFARFPKKLNWQTNRFLFLGLGVFNLGHVTDTFWRSWSDLSKLPMGAMIDFNRMFGEGKSSGDLDRLIRDYGWTPQGIADFYLSLAIICWAVLATAIFYVYVRSRVRRVSSPSLSGMKY